MDLTKYPRRSYTEYATPIVKAEQLSAYLGGPDIYFKRDDLLGLAAGGNKTRKLEFVVADALAKRADTLITCGAIQSNHCRLTLSAAVKEGLDCRLVLEERIPGTYNPKATGNNLLYRLLGAKEIKVCSNGGDVNAAMEEMAQRISLEGHRPYVIPVGASTPIGVLGYIACAQEILIQAETAGIKYNQIICVSGSGGTQAGLVLGFAADDDVTVTGINVSNTRIPQEERVYCLVYDTLRYTNSEDQVSRSEVACLDSYLGAGYAVVTPEVMDAVKLVATLEGVLLDPVYTGKAMVGLIDLIRSGYFHSDDSILFVHTGGSPALYAYDV